MFASSFFCALVRIEVPRAAGKSFFDFVFPEDLESAKKGFAASQIPLALPYPLRLRRSDGTEVWTAIQGQPLQTASGKVYGISTTIILAPALVEDPFGEVRISL
jgi:PAS domain-containing protein